jgi:biopolymer transport protein ExbD
MKSLVLKMMLAAGFAMSAAAADDSQQPEQQARVQVQVQADGRTVVIDEDGQQQVTTKTLIVQLGPDGNIEIKDAPADVKKKVDKARAAEKQQAGEGVVDLGMQGVITIIGPDGVKHTQKFGNLKEGAGPMPNVQQLLEKAMQAAGADLPEDVRDKLKQALKQQGNAQMPKPKGTEPKGDLAEISRKLDRILERLDKLEADVAEMKASATGRK